MTPTIPGEGNNFVLLTSSRGLRQEIVQNDANSSE
jgi:hypothetical protein